MSKEMDILKHAIASKTNYTETLQSMQTANTPEEQQKGLRGAPPNTSMTFPNTSSSFTTKGMDYNINVSKFDNNGNLVQSFANVPPGVDNLPMGNKTGNVIETPAHEGYQTDGYINTPIAQTDNTRVTQYNPNLEISTTPDPTLTEKITTPIRKRLADNLYPYGYHHSYIDGDELVRSGAGTKILRALRGKKDYSVAEAHHSPDGVDNDYITEKKDLLQMLMGFKQKKNTIQQSKYIPTDSKDKKAQYYNSKHTEDNIRKNYSDVSNFINENKGENGRAISTNRVLGDYTLSKGKDENGREYISYYDKWDMDPFKNKTLNYYSQKVQTTLGIDPPELYGRIYSDEAGNSNKEGEETENYQSKGFTKYQSIGHLPPRDNVMQYLHNSGRDTSYVNNVVKHIATQESKNIPTQRQIIDYKKDGTPIYGVGTGKFQYEQGKDGAANTAINRTVLFFKDKLDIDLTTTRHKGYENIYDLYRGDGTNTDFTKLSANEQDAIYLAEQIYSGEDTRDNFDILVKGRTTPPTSSEIFNYWGEFHKKKFDRSVKYKDEKGVDKTKTIKVKWDNLTTKEKKAEKTKWNDRTEDVHMPTDHDTDGNGVPDLIQRAPVKQKEKEENDYYNKDIFKMQSSGYTDDGMYYPSPNMPVIEEKKEDIEQISINNTRKNNNTIPHTYPSYTGNHNEDVIIHKKLESNATLMWDENEKIIKRRPEAISALNPIEVNILQPEASIQDNNYNRNLNLDNQLRVETQAEEDLEEVRRIEEEEKIKEEAKNKRLAERAEEYETYKNKNLASTIDESLVFKNYSTKNKGQVTKLQEFLLNEGYDLGRWGADGKYGPATKKARDEYLADKKKEVESKVSITEYIDSTDNLSRVNFTEHLENNGLFSGGLSPNLELQSLEILGDDERAIMSQKSGFNITNILETELYRPTGSACSEDGCAKGLNEHLRKVLGYEGTMGRTKFRQLFGVQEDAWNLGWKISDEDDGAGGETIFTVFDGSTPSALLNTNSSLNSKLKNLIYDSEAPSIDQFTTGDVLDLFYDGSGSYKDAVSGSKAGNWNTHTGVVSKGPDGNMYITHNVHGVFKSEPLQNVLDRQSNKGAKRKGHIMVASIHRPDWNEAFDLSGTYKDSEGNTYDRETYTLKNIPGIDYKLKTRQDPKKGLRTLSSIASEENVRYVAGIQNNYLYTQTTFGLSDEDMQIITNTSLGVAFQESHYGTADDKAIEANDGEVPSKVYAYYEKGKNKLGGGSTDNFYAYKKNNPGEFGNDVSMGVTQIKLDNLSDDMIKELGMENSNNALILPETAAATTLLRTATTYKFLKAMQKAHPELNITSKNIPHILALGHNQNIFKDIESMLRGTDRKGKRINNTNFDWINAQNGTDYSNSVIMGSKYYDIDWKEFSMGANYKYDLYANNK